MRCARDIQYVNSVALACFTHSDNHNFYYFTFHEFFESNIRQKCTWKFERRAFDSIPFTRTKEWKKKWAMCDLSHYILNWMQLSLSQISMKVRFCHSFDTTQIEI